MGKWSLAAFCAAFFMGASHASLQAQEESVHQERIEEVVVFGSLSRYSALKSDIPILETARSVSIETQQQILDKGALRLDETYTYSAGVTGETFGFATRGDWVRVRGLDVPQFQDSLQSLFGNYNNVRPDIYTLEQVEILKGPASVLFGKGSPGGLVNVVSKRPREESRHELVLEVGNFERTQLALDSTGALNSDGSLLYRMVALYRDAETQVDNVDDESLVIAPSITWRPSIDTNVTVLVNYTDTESDTAAQFLPVVGTLEPAQNGRSINPDAFLGEPSFNRYDAETLSVTLLADHQFNEVFGGELTARYTDGEADYQQAWPSFGTSEDRYIRNADGSLYLDGTVPRSFFKSDATSEQAAIDARLRVHFRTGPFEHRVLTGVQYQDIETDDDGYYAYAVGYAFQPGEPTTPFGDTYWINLFDPEFGNVPPAEWLNAQYTDSPSASTEDIGIYINDEISVANWRLTLGVRYDETETDAGSGAQEDDEVSFATGLLYQFDNGLAPYASFAESFEPVIGDNGNGQPLDPQRGEQWEVGVKYQPAGWPGIVTLAYFDIEQTNLPDPLALPGAFEQQRGEATVKGIELEAQLAWREFTLEVNASQLDTENADGFDIASVPDTQASAWLGYTPVGALDGFRSGIGARYVGSSYGGLDQLKTPSYTLYDLMLGYNRGPWDLALNVRNLTDEEYLATCLARGDCFVGKERTVVARLRYLF